MRDGTVTPLWEDILSVFPKAEDDPFEHLILKDGIQVGRIEVTEGNIATLYVPSIKIEHRYQRRGLGQEALGILCELANKHDHEIWLEAFYHPQQEGGGHLIRLYEKNGFEIMSDPDEDQRVEMRRLPRPEPSPEP